MKLAICSSPWQGFPTTSWYGIAEFAGLEFAGLENDGVEQEETYILHTMKWTQTNVYDT